MKLGMYFGKHAYSLLDMLHHACPQDWKGTILESQWVEGTCSRAPSYSLAFSAASRRAASI